jgi:hypothetical protein
MLFYLDDLETEATAAARPGRTSPAMTRLTNLHALLSAYCDGRTLDPVTELKPIDDGIWEFKAGDVRVYFYRNDTHPRLPAARLTNGFTKRWAGRHPPKHLRQALRVRGEDVKR